MRKGRLLFSSSWPWRWSWWALAIWAAVSVAIISAACSHDVPDPPARTPLFSDASNRTEQFVGGETMPAGAYEFTCGPSGHVSVKLGAAPHTESSESGDQVRNVDRGDTVTVTFCRVYGPR